MVEPHEFDADLDAAGLLCPLPVLKARKRLAALGAGQVLRVRTTDPAAVVDIPHYCHEAGHDLIEALPDGAGHIFFIRKAG